jgi:hypothetical protein
MVLSRSLPPCMAFVSRPVLEQYACNASGLACPRSNTDLTQADFWRQPTRRRPRANPRSGPHSCQVTARRKWRLRPHRRPVPSRPIASYRIAWPASSETLHGSVHGSTRTRPEQRPATTIWFCIRLLRTPRFCCQDTPRAVNLSIIYLFQ